MTLKLPILIVILFIHTAITAQTNEEWFKITDSDIRGVQRLWLPYRDQTAQLLSTIEPTITIEDWKNWLTCIRTKQLRQILELR